jgi:hypothetical protein
MSTERELFKNMTQYDKEFEVFWNAKVIEEAGDRLKLIAYSAWQAARTPQQSEVKPLDLKGGRWFIDHFNKVHNDISSKAWKVGGRERETREQAEAAAEKMRKRDRLHAFATEFMGYEYEYKQGEKNFLITYHHEMKKWILDWRDKTEIPGHNYMTLKCAEYLCAALNDGRLVL